MKTFLLILLYLTALETAAAEYVSFFGRAEKQILLPELEQACPDNHICMDSVYRWTIRIDKIVAGQISGRTVKAASIQHSEFVYANRKQALYVLSRIEDPAKRKLSGADYWLEEYAPPRTLYCVSSNKPYGMETSKQIVLRGGTQTCYVKLNEP
jgi:hypothetical protein